MQTTKYFKLNKNDKIVNLKIVNHMHFQNSKFFHFCAAEIYQEFCTDISHTCLHCWLTIDFFPDILEL
jgi:hypothetical protein